LTEGMMEKCKGCAGWWQGPTAGTEKTLLEGFFRTAMLAGNPLSVFSINYWTASPINSFPA
jgi:hypothetical protein